jgi:hypothetical protein
MGVPDVSRGVMEYYPYRIGRSGLLFRGPKRQMSGRYVAVIGGSETYGKFVAEPYPAQLETRTGLPVANFGCMHASVGVFADDDAVVDRCRAADVTVIQIMGAANISNRFYTVHPRRNDRFLRASQPLRALYPCVDFAEFNFTGHLLTSLRDRSEDAFEEVRDEVQRVWLDKMNLLIDRIGGKIVLLWMSSRDPGDRGELCCDADPLFVDRPMLAALRDDVSAIVEVVASDDARSEGLENKVFNRLEALAAAEVPGPRFHGEVATALTDALAPMINFQGEGEGGAEHLPRAPVKMVRAFR